MAHLTSVDKKASPLDVSSISTSSDSKCFKLPRQAIPTFAGDPLKWSAFWKRFRASIHDNPQLDDSEKLAYLQDTIMDPGVTPYLHKATATEHQYEELVAFLKEQYDKKHLIHRAHTMDMVNYPPLKHGSHEGYRDISRILAYNIEGLKDAGQYDIGLFITSLCR